jgi:CDP-diacylglycerol--glycerol-3-phosphate 3-phosphatidyltransferase
MKTLPNILTILRIILIPVIILLIVLDTYNANFLALIIFIIASLSDYLDGYLARKYKFTSNFGTMLDPIADKLLIILVGSMLCYRGDINGIHLIPFLLIVSREIFISGIREYLAQLNEKISLPVSKLGKYKTAAQMMALFCLLLNPLVSNNLFFTDELGILLLWIASILSLLSGYHYYRRIFN